jgi:hypothetical protein
MNPRHLTAQGNTVPKGSGFGKPLQPVAGASNRTPDQLRNQVLWLPKVEVPH